MSVFKTDSITVIRRRGLEAPNWGLRPTVSKTVRKNTKKEFAKSTIFLFFAKETATVQAQEQRAKDAKSFRRLYASDYNSMLISC